MRSARSSAAAALAGWVIALIIGAMDPPGSIPGDVDRERGFDLVLVLGHEERSIRPWNRSGVVVSVA
jgi:hypothetical protein